MALSGASASHPELYLVAQTNAGAFGAGHLNLAIVEEIPAPRLMDDQSMRLYNLNPAWGSGSVFWIDLCNRGDADELEDQVVRGFVRSERINRADHHCDLGHDAEIYQKGLKITSSEMRRNIRAGNQ
jgi:hypothetical protein